MAALTVAAATQPPDSGRLNNGVYTVLASGAGSTQTAVVAAVAGKKITIIRGWITFDGAVVDNVIVQSANTSLFTAYGSNGVATTIELPRGLYTAAGEALNLKKASTATISCHIEYVVIASGVHLPLSA